MEQRGTRPQAIEQISPSETAIRWNVVENEEGFIYEEKILQCNAVRGEVINALIAEKYPSGAEQAIHRKGILNTKDVEFASYVDFVGKTKKMVDEAINYDKQTTR